LNFTRTTPPCYNNTTLGNRLYAWRKDPNVTNPIRVTGQKWHTDDALYHVIGRFSRQETICSTGGTFLQHALAILFPFLAVETSKDDLYSAKRLSTCHISLQHVVNTLFLSCKVPRYVVSSVQNASTHSFVEQHDNSSWNVPQNILFLSDKKPLIHSFLLAKYL